MAKSVRKDKFRPPQPRNRLIDFDEIPTLELAPEDHSPCKISFRSHDVSLDNFRVYDSTGSADTLVRRDGITNHRSIACSLSNIAAKNYQNRLMCVEIIHRVSEKKHPLILLAIS